MTDENTIFIVSGCERLLNSYANDAFQPEQGPVYEEDDRASRPSGSAYGDDGTPVPDFSTEEFSLAITTALKPKDPSLGYVFGRNANCDIVLDDKAISDRQFAVKIQWQWKTIVLKNHSQHGTRVNFHYYNESVLLRNTRAFCELHTADIHLGSGIKLHIRRLDRPIDWEIYCIKVVSQLPGIDLLQLEPGPESTSVSRRRPVYVSGRRLGSGANAQVFEAVEKYTGAIYAVKLYNKPRHARWQEPEILEKLKHTNIVRYISYNRPAGQPAELVMEFVQGVSLQALLDPYNDYAPLTRFDTRDVLQQLTMALCYLHDEGITHRDLKPANVMVPQREPVRIKLVDFGEATAMKQFNTHCGTPLYIAPEITARKTCTNKVDVFSLGIIALQMLYGLPGNDKGQRTTAARWQAAVRDRMAFLTHRGPQTQPLDFVCRLLHESPDYRPSARQSLRHAFFDPGVNFGPLEVLVTDGIPLDDPPTSIYSPVQSMPFVPEGGADIPDTAQVTTERATTEQGVSVSGAFVRSEAPTPVAGDGSAAAGPAPEPVVLNGRVLAFTDEVEGYVDILEIFLAAQLARKDRVRYFYLLRDRGVVIERNGHRLVPWKDGCFLSHVLKLDPTPLLERASMDPSVLRGNYLLLSQPLLPPYSVMWWNGAAIVYLYTPESQSVNATNLLKACGGKETLLTTYVNNHPQIEKTIIDRGPIQCWGAYLSFEDAYRMCAMGGLDTAPIRGIAAECGVTFDGISFYSLYEASPGVAGGVGHGVAGVQGQEGGGGEEEQDGGEEEEEQGEEEQGVEEQRVEEQGVEEQRVEEQGVEENHQGQDESALFNEDAYNFAFGDYTNPQFDPAAFQEFPAELNGLYWENIPGSMATPVLDSFWNMDPDAALPPGGAAAPYPAPGQDDNGEGSAAQQQPPRPRAETRGKKKASLAEGYSMFEWQGRTVVFKPRDKSINVTRLLREFGVVKINMHNYLRSHPPARKAHVKTSGGAAVGTYLEAGDDVLRACRHHHLDEMVVREICEFVRAAAEGRASSRAPAL